jgi:glyoxylase-like metal-dependent hydrolase (beta-lactamase superfamily II)
MPLVTFACACFFVGLVWAQGQGGGPLPPPNPAYPPPLVKEGATMKVAPHSYVILDGDIPQVPNVGFVVGSRATLIIDPGMGRRNGETVLREAQKLSANTELYVATTHYHVEHTLGYVAMPSARYINAAVQEAEFAELWEANANLFRPRGPVQTELLRDAAGRKADVTFDREYTLDLGGVRVRWTVVGPTHTRGDTILFVVEDSLLFGGDVAMHETFLLAGPDTSMKAWMAAFDLVEKIRPSTIVPSHGKVGDVSLIAKNRALMLEIQTRALALKAQGRSIDDVAATVQKEMQAKYPAYLRINGVGFAARAVYKEAS